MNLKELAAKLDGNEYGHELLGVDANYLIELGIVVVFGASDDLMEFSGSIYDEAGCWDGGIIVMSEFVDESEKLIEALWCEEEDYSWTYKTDIPHETFDILEDDEKYCRGIVFYLKDAK